MMNLRYRILLCRFIVIDLIYFIMFLLIKKYFLKKNRRLRSVYLFKDV